ncbi:hypothetical protein, partial [Clostridium sp.]|uniref:hypothetical protein n=1 Tax=Clostridium sp. TaxID=1506 RepID=UPI0025C14B52
MKKYNKYLVVFMVFFIISLFEITYNVNASNNFEGWYKDTKPRYTYSGSNIFNKNDINGSDIMKKVKTSYTYESRMPKIKDSIYVQKLMYDVNNSGRYWSNYTYSEETPDGSIGYTTWYDSPNGLVLDYLSTFIGGNTTPIVSSEMISYDIKKDIIDWNNIQYKNPNRAYIASTAAEAKLADAKSASALSRTDSNRNYPIYLNDGENIDSDVKHELQEKNIKDLYIMGGYVRFKTTAGLSEGFNIIRAGGLNTQKTYEYMSNLPLIMNDPQHYKPNSEGIVIEGDLGSKFQSVYDELKILKNSRDINVLIKLADKLLGEINLGKEPSKSDKPSLVLGVNVAGFETYWMVYYSKIQEGYVYQFILPGYYEKYQPIPETLTLNGSNYYKNYNDYWFKPNSEINITTNAYMSSISKNYPDTMSLLLNSSEYNVKADMAIVNDEFKNNFKLIGINRAIKSESNNRNYISAIHTFSAINDGTNYSLKFTSKLDNYTAPIIDTGKTIKIDGKAPEINGSISEGWINKDVTKNLSASDGKGSGLKSLKIYDKNNKLIDSGVDSLFLYISDEGIHNYEVKAYDNVGNFSTNIFTVKIDKTPPVISGNDINEVYDWTKNDVVISQNATDVNGSGIKLIELYDSKNKKLSAGISSLKYTVSIEGETEYIVKAYDNAGNISTKNLIVRIDKTPPKIEGTDINNIYGWTKENIIINQSADDNGSGLRSIKLYDDKSTEIANDQYSLWFYIEYEGINNYTVKAYDNVGNVSTKDITVKIDKTPPIGQVTYDYNENTFVLDMSVSNIIEKGSGVDKIWAEFYPEYEEEKKVTQDLINTNNVYKVKRNLFELFPDSIEQIEVVIKARDKVGNEGELFRQVFDPFKIEATITRDWEPYQSIFQEGELGVVRVK